MPSLICPICESDDIKLFAEVSRIPVHINLLFKSRKDAVEVPRDELRLGFCQQCGHIYNHSFDEDKLDYSKQYENSLHFSPKFADYAEKLARDLIVRHHISQKEIIDIGCGDGTFLELLCELGDNKGIGFDPSAAPDRYAKNGNIKFIRDRYSPAHSNQKVDLICCRHVLEHIKDPRAFIENIKETLGPKSNPILFFEVPNVMYTLQDFGIWDLIYEHCSYFCKTSLQHLFARFGFRALNLTTAFDHQFLLIEAKASNMTAADSDEDRVDVMHMQNLVREFSTHFSRKINKWKTVLDRLGADKNKTVVWGAGSKGTTFLNMIDDNHAIEYVVDINPKKTGHFIAGTGQRIVDEAFLKQYRPQTVIIMNPAYLDEITKTIRSLNLMTEIIIA
jgi:2-polyprenyl-3-methyl-5-hydroxy-6-metoxy-1,4-benzoquinol methylase